VTNGFYAPFYKLLKKWGNDFTLFRRFLGIITKNLFPIIMINIFILISISTASVKLINITHQFFFHSIFGQDGPSAIIARITGGLLIVAICVMLIFFLVYNVMFYINKNKSFSFNHLITKNNWMYRSW